MSFGDVSWCLTPGWRPRRSCARRSTRVRPSDRHRLRATFEEVPDLDDRTRARPYPLRPPPDRRRELFDRIHRRVAAAARGRVTKHFLATLTVGLRVG